MTIVIGNIQQVFGNKPWDMVLMDVSSDMNSHGANDVSESGIANQCIEHLMNHGMSDSIMLFARGRVTLPVGELPDMKNDYSDILRIIGDGTSINDALASCLGTTPESGKILVITNGREVGSSISSNTLSKLMRSRGVQVDAIIVSSGCDSIYVTSAYNPNDSIGYERTPFFSGLNNIVKKTGGNILTIGATDDIDKSINGFISSIAKKDTKPSKKRCDLNAELTDRSIARIKPQKINICEVDTNVVLTYRGSKHHGLADILKVGNSNASILIDHDMNPNSGACNIVFFSAPDERDAKQSVLHQITPSNSYCKLKQDTPIDLLPMIYYSGTGSKMLICGLEYDYEEAENDEMEEEE